MNFVLKIKKFILNMYTNTIKPLYDEILPNFFIGNVVSAEEPVIYSKFKTIIRLNDYDADPDLKSEYKELGINYFYYKIPDFNTIKPIIIPVCNIINNNPKPILIHCKDGCNRSVAIFIAYLMVYRGYSLSDAYYLVKQKHKCTDITLNFYRALKKLQDFL